MQRLKTYSDELQALRKQTEQLNHDLIQKEKENKEQNMLNDELVEMDSQRNTKRKNKENMEVELREQLKEVRHQNNEIVEAN